MRKVLELTVHLEGAQHKYSVADKNIIKIEQYSLDEGPLSIWDIYLRDGEAVVREIGTQFTVIYGKEEDKSVPF